MWYNLTIFIGASIGLTMVATRSGIIKPTREWFSKKVAEQSRPKRLLWFLHEIFNCSLCFGVWGGIPIYIIVYRELSWNIITFALISSLVAYTYAEVIDYVKRN